MNTINSIKSGPIFSCSSKPTSKNDFYLEFTRIVQDKKTGGMNAKDFLSSLSPDKRVIIQQAQGLANKIDDTELSEEGVENLFVDPRFKREYLDLNNDGITEIGEAKVLIFPPSNAPIEVKEAWDKTVERMSDSERVLAESSFLGMQIDAERGGNNKNMCNFGNTVEEYKINVRKLITKLEESYKLSGYKHTQNFEFRMGALSNFYNSL